ncbi:MAG: tetratricopeptide repeat protein, partial [Bacteroidota bacterium]
MIDFQKITELATESSKKEEYGKTLEIFERINVNDSAYCSAMVSKAYYLMALEKYEEAIDVTDSGLASDCGDLHSSFYINKVVALLGAERPKEAIEVCDAGLLRFPQNTMLWYNRGVCLEKVDRISEAVRAYEKVIVLDPFYKKAYLQLGNICY